jgi:hypothetical protein
MGQKAVNTANVVVPCHEDRTHNTVLVTHKKKELELRRGFTRKDMITRSQERWYVEWRYCPDRCAMWVQKSRLSIPYGQTLSTRHMKGSVNIIGSAQICMHRNVWW